MSAEDRDPLNAIPEGFTPVVALDRCFDAVYGLEILEADSEGALRGRVAIRDELRQPSGLVHGGVVAAFAEALASRGTWIGLGDPSKLVMGLSNDSNFLRPLLEGHINATAIPRHRGRTRWLWEVRSRDDQDRLCAITMVNISVRDRPA